MTKGDREGAASGARVDVDRELDALLEELGEGRCAEVGSDNVARSKVSLGRFLATLPAVTIDDGRPSIDDERASQSPKSSVVHPTTRSATTPAEVLGASKEDEPIAASRAIARRSLGGIHWDDLSHVYSDTPDHILLSRLTEQVQRVAKGGGFDSERAEYRALHLALNRKLVTPPRFRPLIRGKKPGAGVVMLPEDKALIVDKQVIDLDWLHCAGKRERIAEADMEDMFVSEHSIDWVAAERLATKKWHPGTKAISSLRLADAEQFPLVILQTPKLKTRWAEILRDTPLVETTLKNRADKHPKLLPHVNHLTTVWQADELGHAASLKTKARLHQWLSGANEPISQEQMREQIRRVRRHLESVGKGTGGRRA